MRRSWPSATATIPWTQVAGRKCQACWRTIATMKDGVACIECGDVIHLDRCTTKHAAHRHAVQRSVYR
jgi:hypothetical protein